MRMSKQDIKQESYINPRWVDVQRSPAWSNSYRNRTIVTDIDVDSLSKETDMEYIDNCIDLYRAINNLSELQKTVMLLTINGVKQTTIASLIDCNRSYISKIYKKSIEDIKKYLKEG